jgi:hypothetical protein
MPIVTNGVSAVECNAAKCIARRIFHPTTQRLKANKPYPKIDFHHPDALLYASSNYMWRILAFDLCDHTPHNSLPCTAIWDINNYFWVKAEPRTPGWIDTLNEAIKQIEATIPVAEHHGADHWGYAHTLLKQTN